MVQNIIHVDKQSGIPLFGIDFLGIIDRGTNILEIKPITLCNLKCRYCFVSSGDYLTNFTVSADYIIEKLKNLVDIKGNYNLEVHLAPYGEIFLYSELFDLIKKLREIPGVETLSIQSNGLLLNEGLIKRLEIAGITRINLSLNTLNPKLAENLSNCSNYNIEVFLNNIELLLDSKIDVLLAPVWFPGENDSDIEEIIQYVKCFRTKGYDSKKIQLGIQKYLIYKTGRKLKKIRPKTWDYFYKQLSQLEHKYEIKLKLGPNDFGIHKREMAISQNLQKNQIIKARIISRGRWSNECIAKIEDDIGIKLLINKPITFSENLLNKEVMVKVIKANYRDNIITAFFPISK